MDTNIKGWIDSIFFIGGEPQMIIETKDGKEIEFRVVDIVGKFEFFLNNIKHTITLGARNDNSFNVKFLLAGAQVNVVKMDRDVCAHWLGEILKRTEYLMTLMADLYLNEHHENYGQDLNDAEIVHQDIFGPTSRWTLHVDSPHNFALLPLLYLFQLMNHLIPLAILSTPL